MTFASDRSLAASLRQMPLSVRRQALLGHVRQWLTEIFVYLSPEEIGEHQFFIDLGTDSLKAVDFKTLLEQRLECSLRSTLLFDYPRLDQLLDFLAGDVLAPAAADEQLGAPLEEPAQAAAEPLAIVGLACRLPGGVQNPDDLWALLRDGVDAITPVPSSRWPAHYHDPDPLAPGRIRVPYGGFLDHVDQFDAQFFGISPREALQLDPQQRLLLECTWHALEDAGLPVERLQGREIGVFVGTRGSEYFDFQAGGDLNLVDAWHATGNALSTAAGRLSFTLGWTGPAIAVDTACSSSLVALHLACESVRRGESEMALAAGVNLLLSPISSIGTSKADMLAEDGRCKTFSADADGYVRAEGCVALLIKPLQKAVDDGNRIWGVVRGTAANQDGASGGLTVPSGAAQEAVIRKALRQSGVTARDVDHVEAHGTGTALGDPIEVNALAAVYGVGRPLEQPVWLGALKTHIGHTEPVSGLAGVAKVLVSLREQRLPRLLHCHQLSPHIRWQDMAVRPLTEARAWPRGERPRIAGVSSFGFSGTNAHVVISEPPALPVVDVPQQPAVLLPLSARSEGALRDLARSHGRALRASAATSLNAWAAAAALGRSQLPWRSAVVVRDREDALEQLSVLADAPLERSWPRQRRIAFLFSGQGSQFAGMGRDLYDHSAVFRAAVDECCTLLAPELPRDLRSVMWGEQGDLINQTTYTQPALFVFEYALTRLWASWGVEPAVVLGHSVGEYVAACLAGIFSLPDALRLIAARGRLIGQLPDNGKMAVVLCDLATAQKAVADYADTVSLAAYNSPAQQVVSGDAVHVDLVCQSLQAAGVRCVMLPVSHAFHSPLMRPMLEEFRAVARTVTWHQPTLPLVSNVSGRLGGAEMATPDYWVNHVVAPVNFVAGVTAIADCDVVIEAGPRATLLGLARHCLPASDALFVASLGLAQDGWAQLLQAAATLYCSGIDLKWDALYECPVAPQVTLPLYPFDRKRFWFDSASTRVAAQAPASPAPQGHAAGQLPGVRVRSPLQAQGREQYVARLSPVAPAWLGDHRVYGEAVMPAAAWLATAIEAARASVPDDVVCLRDLAIQSPLVVPDAGVDVHCVTSRTADGLRVELFSDAGERWVPHATVTVEQGAAPLWPALSALRAACSERRDVAAFYADYEKLGLAYGPRLRCIEQLAAGEQGAFARLSLPLAAGNGSEFALHPALLDACFQSLRGAGVFGVEESWLPVGCEALYLQTTRVGTRIDCYSVVRPAGAANASRSIDLYLTDADGAPLAMVSGLQLLRANAATFGEAARATAAPAPAPAGWLYDLQWQAQALPAPDLAQDPGRDQTWLVLANQGPLASEFFQILSERGVHYDALYAEDFADAQRLAAQLDRRLGAGEQHDRVVSLWACRDAATEPAVAAEWLCHTSLLLCQTLAARGRIPPLALVTEAALQPQQPCDLDGALVWGIGRTVQLELPQLQCRLFDVSGGSVALNAEALYYDLVSPVLDGQVAWHDGERRVARLSAWQPTAPDFVAPAAPYRVGVSAYGDFAYLEARSQPRRVPQGAEVEVEVKASALNFKDVLHALGLLQEFSQARGITQATEQDFGYEAAGRVTAVGPDVTGLQPGDAVLVSAPHCLASHVLVEQTAVMPMPPGLDWQQAAALQTVFLTSLYGLEERAQLQADEWVLIHAAAGGVGQAALQVARARGARVIATASQGKWAYLREQGVEHVFDSRASGTALDTMVARIRELTQGRGVDVVLNSLTGDFIPASLGALAEGGRFVEIGKRGIWSAEQMRAARPDVQYFTFDMGDVAISEPALYRTLQQRIGERYASGTYAPLAVTSFPLGQLRAAFRHLAQAHNIGKVVVDMAAPTQAAPVRADATYLLTGGLGGLARLAIEWLIERGARHIALVARREPDATGLADLARYRERADVRLYQADVTNPAQLDAAFAAMQAGQPPLAGVLHTAGVLADGTLLTQTPERFGAVLPPKVAATWHLHRLTEGLALDFFLCYSSVVAVLGGLGQANYGAANAWMDALAHYRRARGLPATSVAWGPWAEVGMAAERAGRNEARFAAMGIHPLEPQEALAQLPALMLGGAPQVAVLDVQWPAYVQQLPREYDRALFDRLQQETAPEAAAASPGAGIVDDLQQVQAAGRQNHLEQWLLQQLAAVLGYGNTQDLHVRDRLFDLGVDSLLAVNLKTRLEAGLQVTLPATLVFDYPTIESLARWLLAEKLAFADAATPAQTSQQQAMDELADKSAADIALLLQQALGDEWASPA